MGIFGEWVLNKLKQRIYAVSHAKVVVRNKSTVDQDLTNLENRATSLEENVTTVKQQVTSLDQNVATVKQQVNNLEENVQSGVIADGTAIIMLGTANATGEVTIPTEGWVKDADRDEYHLDIENSAINESIVPVIAISPDHYDRATECGLKPYCRTLEGILRLYADTAPSQPITASIALIGEKDNSVDVNNLPLATSTTAGVVKPGTGFTVDSNTGALTVDTNVVVTDDDMVDESAMANTIKTSLQQ